MTQAASAQRWAPWNHSWDYAPPPPGYSRAPQFFEPEDEPRRPPPPRQRRGSDDDEDGGPGMLTGGPRPHISPIPPRSVAFRSNYGAGSIVIDTAARRLYLVQSGSQALMYPISVGREGFAWTGTQKISRIAEWPDWRPPAEMREREPRLPELMTGGIRNPLGAKALYLGNTLYRIHGTNSARSIGRAASSGCFRMLNGHVLDLASRVHIGTTVHVVSRLPASVASR